MAGCQLGQPGTTGPGAPAASSAPAFTGFRPARSAGTLGGRPADGKANLAAFLAFMADDDDHAPPPAAAAAPAKVAPAASPATLPPPSYTTGTGRPVTPSPVPAGKAKLAAFLADMDRDDSDDSAPPAAAMPPPTAITTALPALGLTTGHGRPVSFAPARAAGAQKTTCMGTDGCHTPMPSPGLTTGSGRPLAATTSTTSAGTPGQIRTEPPLPPPILTTGGGKAIIFAKASNMASSAGVPGPQQPGSAAVAGAVTPKPFTPVVPRNRAALQRATPTTLARRTPGSRPFKPPTRLHATPRNPASAAKVKFRFHCLMSFESNPSQHVGSLLPYIC